MICGEALDKCALCVCVCLEPVESCCHSSKGVCPHKVIKISGMLSREQSVYLPGTAPCVTDPFEKAAKRRVFAAACFSPV